MTLRLLLLLLGVVLLLNFAAPERTRKYYYHARKLHSLTTEIQDRLQKIAVNVEDVNVENCGKIDSPEGLVKQEQQLHRKLRLKIIENMRQELKAEGIDGSVISYEQKGLPYDEEKRIVRSEDIIYQDKDIFREHKAEYEDLEDYSARFLKKIKRYERLLDRCAKKYARCQEFINNRDYKIKVHAVRNAAQLLHRLNSKGSPCDAAEDIKRALSEIDQKLKTLDDSYTQTLLKALEQELMAKEEECGKNRARIINQNERNAHASWVRVHRLIVNYRRDTVYNQYLERSANCEYEYILNASARWNLGEVLLDEQWIITQKERYDKYGKRGCNLPCADNYVPNTSDIEDNISCKGCLDPKAVNYCQYSNIPAPCIYIVCQDTSYWESRPSRRYPNFRPHIDQVIKKDTLCLTPRFGCMDKLCDNYNPDAIYDLKDQCDCCCNNETAVNYDPDCNDMTGKLEACHWKGCMSKCALNYNPKATSDYPSGSCICDTISEIQLEQKIRLLSTANQIADDRSDRDISKNFRSRFRKSDQRTQAVSRTFTFERQDADLNIAGDINLSGLASDIETGAYWYPPIYQVIDSLVDFLYYEAANFQQRNIYADVEGIIIGEADNAPVRNFGIPYYTDGTNQVSNHPVLVLSQSANTDAKQILLDYEQIPPMTAKQSLAENGHLEDNPQLAFARAFLVKNRLLLGSGNRIEPDKISIFIRENNARGGKYRKITVGLRVRNFFGENTVDQVTIAERLKRLKDLRRFYRQAGKFPEPGSTFRSCPCLE